MHHDDIIAFGEFNRRNLYRLCRVPDDAKVPEVEFSGAPRYYVPAVWAAKMFYGDADDPVPVVFAELVELFSCSYWRYQCEHQHGTMQMVGTISTGTHPDAVSLLDTHPLFNPVAIAGEHTLLVAHYVRPRAGFLGVVAFRENWGGAVHLKGGSQIMQVFTFDYQEQ